MTQAFNLSQFANKLNSSGATDNTGLQNSSVTVNTTAPINGGGAIALGSSLTITHATSGVTANSYTNPTITVNSQGHITAASSGASSVTSVATGNGLSGGTITTTGTLIIACPTWGSIGSYATGVGTSTGSYTSGSYNDATLLTVNTNYTATNAGISGGSGTWKCMGVSGSKEALYTYPVGCGGTAYGLGTYQYFYLFCRVS